MDEPDRKAYDEASVTQRLLDRPIVLPLRTERVDVVRRNVVDRVAKITRRAVTVRETFEVDVVHEELHVEYVAGDGTEPASDAATESFSVLLHAEDVEIVKRVRVVEEAVISKRVVCENVRFPVTLLHEELDALALPDANSRAVS